jgi:GWxTD domain-containing protein
LFFACPDAALRAAGLAARIVVLAFLALLTPARAHAGGTPDLPGPMPWRTGGRLPFTVDAATFPDSAGLALEVYIRIPPATLGAATPDSFGVAQLLIRARLKTSYGAKQRSHEELIHIMPSDSASGFGKVVLMRFPTRPGTQRLSVRVEDLHSRKRGILYMGRQVTDFGEYEGDFQSPKPQSERDLSDVEFVWDETDRTAGAGFVHDTTGFLPNPERLYGLYASDLRAVLSARSPSDSAWRWAARIYDPTGRLMLEKDSTGSASHWLHAPVRMDISTLPAGGYDLEFKAWQQGDAGALVRKSHFSIAWHTETWTSDPADIEDAVHLLLSSEREDAFMRLEPGEREHFLEDYWRARDPSPGTAENEAYDEFVKRVEYANRTFTRAGLQKGMLSDMGRTYIRYGPPDEVLHEVIPAGDNTLDQMLDEIEATETRSPEDVRQHGLGGDTRPFEVWIYEGVIPPPMETEPKDKGNVRRRKLTFLFVDSQGLGQYTLRYTTE